MEDFTLEEFVVGDNSVVLVMILEAGPGPAASYSVRWLVNRKFGFKTFESDFHAVNFFNEIKSAVSAVSAID